MKQLTWPFLILIVTIALGACKTKKSEGQLMCVDLLMPIYANFRFTDKISGQDLFFSTDPKYALKDLAIYSTKDKDRKNPVTPEVLGTGADRYFRVQVGNTIFNDTLIVKIASTPEDQVTYSIKKIQSICPEYILDKVYFNNKEVAQIQNKLIFQKAN